MPVARVLSSSHALHSPEVAPEHTHHVQRAGSRAPDPVTAAVPQERAGWGPGRGAAGWAGTAVFSGRDGRA